MEERQQGVVLSISADQEDNCSREQALEDQSQMKNGQQGGVQGQRQLLFYENTCSNKICHLYTEEHMESGSTNNPKYLCLNCKKQYEKQQFCFYCKQIYFQETDDGKAWIMCDICLKWLHLKCLDQNATLDQFQHGFNCQRCMKNGQESDMAVNVKSKMNVNQGVKQLGVQRRKVKECTLNKFGFYWELSTKQLMEDLQKLNLLIA